MRGLHAKRAGLREPPLLFVTGGGLALGLYEFTLEVPWLRYVVARWQASLGEGWLGC